MRNAAASTQPAVADTVEMYSPAVTIHTIAGTGPHPADGGRGDLVVPLTSAHVDEAVSEHHVRATHSSIYYNTDTIDEVRAIHEGRVSRRIVRGRPTPS